MRRKEAEPNKFCRKRNPTNVAEDEPLLRVAAVESGDAFLTFTGEES